MKAIILTSAPVNSEEEELLKSTSETKVAINFHAEHLKPNYRICSDYYIIGDLLKFCSQKIITTREWCPDDRLIYAGHIQFKGSTMVAAIEYLISEGFNEILIVGDNSVHDKIFQDRIKKEISQILIKKPEVNIYQYGNGNFNLKTKTITEFLRKE